MIKSDGTREWWDYGELHRENDQPAVIKSDGTREWWVNDRHHRDGDQPAVVKSDGTREWWFNGERHRENDQPAVVKSDGTREWYINGEFHRDNDQPAVVKSDGTREWYINGEFHRDNDQPAVMNPYSRMWYKHGKLHRDGDLPAVIGINGTKQWYKNGHLHREGDLPASINPISGLSEWYKDGIKYRYTARKSEVSQLDESRLSYPIGYELVFDIKEMYLNLLGLNKSPNKQFDKFITAYVKIITDPSNASVLSFYTKHGDELINTYLRGNSFGKLVTKYNMEQDVLIEYAKQMVLTMNKIMKNIPPIGVQQTVFRGMGGRDDLNIKLTVGDEVNLMSKGYNSTSYMKPVAKKFAGECCCLFEMKLPKNVKGLCLMPISQFDSEFEFLLAPGYLFKVSKSFENEEPQRFILECMNANEVAKKFT